MSIVDTMINSFLYERLYSPSQQQAFQEKRLQKLVRYVKASSPYLGELYQNIGEDFSLRDLPITNKQMIMEHYDDWVTDRRIKLRDIQEFVSHTENIGRPFCGKYLVASTSGSTGYPLHFILNRKIINVSTCSALLHRALRRKPVALVFPDNLFLIVNGAILENSYRFPHIMKHSFPMVNAMLPPEQIAGRLNALKPKTVYGYTSVIEAIAEQAERGNLTADIQEAVCCSERLTDKTRAYIESQLHCTARSIYGCTESGNIAMDCPEGHMHLMNPYVILELVDEHNQPVKNGEKAYKVLLTNLVSDTLPIIRYELMDHMVLHEERCSCGARGSWIEVEGRSGLDLLEFENGVKIAPFLVYVLVETIDAIRKFQIILHDGDRLELRAIFMPGADPQSAFRQARKQVLDYLKKCGVTTAELVLSDQAPAVDPRNRKFKSVYQIHDR